MLYFTEQKCKKKQNNNFEKTLKEEIQIVVDPKENLTNRLEQLIP